MLSLDEVHFVIHLLKKAHINQVQAIINYAESIILKNKSIYKNRSSKNF